MTCDTYHSQVVEWPSLLNVLQCLLQILQLGIDNCLGLLRSLDSLALKGLDGLELPLQVVRGRLERAELLLDVVDDGLVLQDAAVMGEVDGLRLLGEQLNFATGIIVALLESLQGGGGAAFEAELAGKFRPVEFEGGAALQRASLRLVFGVQLDVERLV